MAPEVTMTTWYNDVQGVWRGKVHPPCKVQHRNVAAVLFSLSLSIMMYYPAHACARRGNGIGVGVHIYMYIYMYVTKKRFELTFSG